MKITVIGAGNMGSAFVSQLVRAGHQVSVTARDGAKAAELHAKDTTGSFVKDENADVRSILAGMIGKKGAVHVCFGSPVRVPEGATAESVAELIDAQVVSNYKLHLVNYLALEKLRNDYMDFARLPDLFGMTASAVEAKRQEFNRRLQALPEAHRPYVQAMYANPVLRKSEVDARPASRA